MTTTIAGGYWLSNVYILLVTNPNAFAPRGGDRKAYLDFSIKAEDFVYTIIILIIYGLIIKYGCTLTGTRIEKLICYNNKNDNTVPNANKNRCF